VLERSPPGLVELGREFEELRAVVEGRPAEAWPAQHATRRMREVAALYTFADRFAHAERLEDVYEAALDAIIAGLECDRASILVFDQNDVMRFVAWRGLSDQYRRAVDGHSPWKANARDPQPIALEDVLNSNEPEDLKKTIAVEGIRGLAFIPLIANGCLIGKFMTYYNKPHAFENEELRLAATIASQIALGIARKRARDGEKKLADLLMLSHEPMFSWKLDGPIEFWNVGAERLYGFTSSDAVGHSSHSLLQTKFPGGLAELRSQLRKERYWAGELRHICKDGHEAIVDSRMQLLSDDTVLEVNRDVTELKKLSTALDESEKGSRSLAAIVESSDDAIVSKNLDGIVASWNSGAERVFGYSAEEAIGQPITIVIPEDRLHEEHEILTRVRRGERVDHFETVRRKKDGSPIDVSLSVSPVKNAQGQIVGASKIARDITEQKRAQEQITALARETEHRSKNVLANVQAIVTVSQSDTPEGLKRAIEGRIRALASVHSLFVETRWRGANLQTIAKNELAPYSQADERRVQIYGPPLLLAPDIAQAMAMTLHELATNAAKYGALSAPDGRIDLKWSRDGAGTLILHWTEIGGPAVQKPTRRGFGSRIIERMIGQLNGKIGFDWRADGLVCQITFDMPL
jgi:PAS domain S-box-containing protein